MAKNKSNHGSRAFKPAIKSTENSTIFTGIKDLFKLSENDDSGGEIPLKKLFIEWKEQWVDNLKSMFSLLYENLHKHPAVPRLMIFKHMDGQWRFGDVHALTVDGTLDFDDLRWMMDNALQSRRKLYPVMAVWILPSSVAMQSEMYYMHMDMENCAVHAQVSIPGTNNRIGLTRYGRATAEKMGEVVWANHSQRLSPWFSMTDDYLDELKNESTEEIKIAIDEIAKTDIGSSLSEDSWGKLMKLFFRHDRFLQLLMDAGRFHAHNIILEEQTLIGRFEALQDAHKTEIDELKSHWNVERERERKKHQKVIDHHTVQANGIKNRADRVDQDNAALQKQVKDLIHAQSGSGRNEELSKNTIKDGFELLFSEI